MSIPQLRVLSSFRKVYVIVITLSGHNGIVSYVSWSHDNKWLLSSSNDKTAAIWTIDVNTVMTIKTKNNNFGVNKEAGLKIDEVKL